MKNKISQSIHSAVLLISPSWNVNLTTHSGYLVDCLLLISPSWNVNLIADAFAIYKGDLLISPSWNVNIMREVNPAVVTITFNLTKLECKSIPRHSTAGRKNSFNLTKLEIILFYYKLRKRILQKTQSLELNKF